ncbi:melanoma-associated antigen E1 [Onychomys torridus]|uniref:melanoma-associated antigen E1 n=1 Tax=Onychomys torridus TaxID=38674 RepID=UPI00167F7483|nr:melanoma-associated antigen E1 [Onychomys torridus]
MSLVSQNSRRRRGGRANSRNSKGKGLPAAVPGPDVPKDPSDPQILQGLCASEGPGTSVMPTPREGPSTSVSPTASAGSSASGQLLISKGLNTSELPISGEGPGTSRPLAVSAGLNTAMSITAAEGPSTSVPPTAPKGSKASEHLGVSEGLNISEQPHSDEGPGGQPTPGEGLGTSVPPPFSEESGISVPLPSGEGLSASVSPTVSEGPGINLPSPASEARRPSVPPTASDGLGINLPSTPAEGRSTSVLLSVLEEPDISVSPPSTEGLSISMSPPSREVQSTWVPPTILEGSGVNAPPTSKKGLRTSVPPAAPERLSTSAEGGGTSVRSIAAEGFSISVASCAAEGSATCGLLPCIDGPSTSGLHILEEDRCTSGLHILGEGASTSQMPLAAEGLGASGMSTAADNPEAPLTCGASVGMNLCKCASLALQKDSGPVVRPKRSEGFLDFQVLRDSENSNSITIMGLGTAHVALTLKPQDPMEQNVAELLQFLLVKDQTKYPIKESEMRQFIVKEYRNQFPEILRRAAAHLECIFRFELKELDSEEHTYILLNKLGPVPFEGLEDIPNGPKMGLLMMILGQIFLNGNQAREADIWEMLWRFGVQRERRLSVFGNPKRLLSVEFVWQRYLDYRPITDCVPVEYEFYWGPRSHLETTKMKILKFMAKIYNKDPMDWPAQYNEALEEDANRDGGDWRAVPHFRRPFFEEVSPELLAPDSDAPGCSSKYSPHSWPESRLESKSRKLVQLFLLMDSTKLPIPKKGILYYIGRECSKVFPDLLNRAARTLNNVYGTELVVLDPRNHSYTLYNRREMEDIEEIVDSPNRPGNNFLMQVLSFIFIMGNHARESAVWAFLRGLGVQNGRKHVITCRYLSQRYLDSLRVPDSDPVQYDFVWGPRARLETSKMKALRYVARIHRKEPQDWPDQYREALEDEANRAEAHRPLVVRNLR